MQSVCVRSRFLVSFKDGCEYDLTPNQPTSVTLDRTAMTKEAEIPMISTKSEDEVYLEKLYYHGVYVLIMFNMDGGFNIKEE